MSGEDWVGRKAGRRWTGKRPGAIEPRTGPHAKKGVSHKPKHEQKERKRVPPSPGFAEYVEEARS